MRAIVALSVLASLCFCLTLQAARKRPEIDITVRVRPLRVEPLDKVRIEWRHGGEGLGGDVTRGEFTAVKPEPPPIHTLKELGAPGAEAADELGLGDPANGPHGEVVVQEMDTYDLLYLPPKAWTPAVPYSALRIGRRNRFLTLTPHGLKHGTDIKRFDVEIEFAWRGKVLASVIERGTAGPTCGILVPGRAIDANGRPTPEFAALATGITGVAERRRRFLESLPWADLPTPRLFGLPNHLQGFGLRPGFGVRSGSHQAMIHEFESLLSIGCNGLAQSAYLAGRHSGAWAYLATLKRPDGTFYLDHFKRVAGANFPGYPVPYVDFGRSPHAIPPPGAGCPYFPDRKDAGEVMDDVLTRCMPLWIEAGFPEVKGWTQDEIGTVFDRAPEGKAHMGACPHCIEGFRAYLRSQGLTPADFGATSWDPLMPLYGYGGKTWAEKQTEKAARNAAQTKALKNEAVTRWFDDRKTTARDAEAVVDKSDEEVAAEQKAPADPAVRKTAAQGVPIPPAVQGVRQFRYRGDTPTIPLPDEGAVLLYYYSRRFNCYASAKLFASQKAVVREWNARKQAALDRGEAHTLAAKQPWIFCGAMRGNTYLMGGHSLDFFNFYRHADNMFTYETSNRDARVWIWDGLLCNVGRVLLEKGLVDKCSIYVKPHRGAVLQRTLQAAANGFTCLNWYTYGANWAKGDSFSGREKYLRLTSKASRLLAAGEEVLYGGRPAEPARVALLRPRTSEFLGNSASWEDGKWTYVALTHGQMPVDPIDEGLLMSGDLSQYKAIYVCGSHLRRDAARALADWVKRGGHLFTAGWGLARDEADRPLDVLHPVLGLAERDRMRLWANVRRYGATRLAGLRPIADAPPGARVDEGGFPLAVGREVLHPVDGAEILARYADGGAAVTRHRFGVGSATVCGFYAGLEYSADVLGGAYDQSTDFNPAKRAVIVRTARQAGVEPVVDTGVPTVEGDLVVHPETQRKVVVLMNWAYKPRRELVHATDLVISVRADGVTRARSAWFQRDLPAERRDGRLVIQLDTLEEGDVLLLN